MKYTLLKDLVDLLQEFETTAKDNPQYPQDIEGFKLWIAQSNPSPALMPEPQWQGKELGRSAESIINTLIVHMNRYAKNYSKSAMHGSAFSTQEEFIYLIILKASGEMTKMELIKKNIQDKPVGMQIINRLLSQGWVSQSDSPTDKRSKLIRITPHGLEVLENQMKKIRQATSIVTGNLTQHEKMELIRILDKLNEFHHPLYCQNIETDKLLDEALKSKTDYAL
jgi:DNA-binding MarR family transcriptional regulator